MAVTKSYASAETAQKIADKLTQKSGIANTVVEQNGKWIIVAAEQPTDEKKVDTTEDESVINPAGAPQHEEFKVDNGEMVPVTQPTQKVLHGDTVTIEISGAKLTAQYVITPVLGAKPRWFERKRLDNAEAISDGVRITCSTKELTSRGLGYLLAQLNEKANAPETAEHPAVQEDAPAEQPETAPTEETAAA